MKIHSRLSSRLFILQKESGPNYDLVENDSSHEIIYIKWLKNDLKGYKVQKGITNYICKNDFDEYKVKYEPINIYGKRYTLCFEKKKKMIYLYDRLNNIYTCLGNMSDIEFDDKFIHDKENSKHYLIYNEKMYDITDYYQNNLRKKDDIIINNIDLDILTRDEFAFLNMQEIEALLEKEKEKKKELAKKIERQKKVEFIEKAKNEEQQQKKERQEAEKHVLLQLQSALVELNKLTNGHSISSRITLDNIFVKVDSHLEIPDIFKDILKFVDLNGIRFDNVKVSGIDFKDSNIDFTLLNPQTVYNKDLSNCNFEGIYISPFINFKGVDIRGSHFSNDNDARTLDMFPHTFIDAIYDENTTYDGKPIVELLEDNKKSSRMTQK